MKWFKTIFKNKPRTHCFETLLGCDFLIEDNIIYFTGTLRLDGEVKCKGIKSKTGMDQEKTNSDTIILGENGKIVCEEIYTGHMIINGSVITTSLCALQSCHIGKTSNVNATEKLLTRELSIESGGKLNSALISNTILENLDAELDKAITNLTSS